MNVSGKGYTKAQVEQWAKEHVSPEQARVELWRRWMADMGRKDLFFLAREILGFKDLDSKFHWEQCKRLESWPLDETGYPVKVMADFWPRGGFKTTLASVARCIQLVIRCPEETILIEHGVLDKANNILQEIKDHLEDNAILKWLYPEIFFDNPKRQAPTWTKEAATCKRVGKYKEKTFQTSSAESDSTGGHYTFIDFDDLVCEENVNTLEAMNRVYRHMTKFDTLKDERNIRPEDPTWKPWYKSLQGWELRQKGVLWLPARVAIIATRWDARDANSRVIDPNNKEWAGMVDVNIQQAIRKDGTSFFPARFPLRELENIKRRMGPFSFSAQYQQDPYPEDAQLFKKEYFQFWTDNRNEKAKFLPPNLLYYTAVDPNIKSDDPNADFGVVMTVALDGYGNFYVMKIDRDHFTPNELNDAILAHVKIFDPRWVGIETAGYQHTAISWIKEKAAAMGVNIRIKEIPRGGRSAESKTRRIQSIEPVLAAHRVYLRKNDAQHKLFMDEAIAYPRGNDDQLDAFSDIVKMAKPPALERKEKKRVEAGDEPEVNKANMSHGHDILLGLGVGASTGARRTRRSRVA